MTNTRRERRGDRRTAPATCGTEVVPGLESERCGGELVEAIQEAGVVVYCKRCGAVDRRSTEGNRRRAELELGELCRRIERELGARVVRLEDHVEQIEATVEYHSERASSLEGRIEDRRHEIHNLERKVDAVEYTADEAKREAERARQEAERAGRGW